jgi:hypothetical protein
LADRLGGAAPNALIPEVRADELAIEAGIGSDVVERWLAEGRELTVEGALALARE